MYNLYFTFYPCIFSFGKITKKKAKEEKITRRNKLCPKTDEPPEVVCFWTFSQLENVLARKCGGMAFGGQMRS